MTDENIVLNRDAFADKRMTGNLAAPSHFGVFLNFDERSNLRFITDLASVQVDEFGEPDSLSQFHIRCN